MACALFATDDRHHYQPILIPKSDSMRKVQRLSKAFPLEIVAPDLSFPIETVAESDGSRPRPASLLAKTQCFGTSLKPQSKTASEDSCSWKRKSMSLNATGLSEYLGSAGVFYNLSSKELTSDKRKLLRKRLKLDLEEVRRLHHKLEVKELQLRACGSTAVPHENHKYANGTKFENLPSKLNHELSIHTPQLVQREARLYRQQTVASDLIQDTLGNGDSEKRTFRDNQSNVGSDIVPGKDKKPVSDKMKTKSAVEKRSLQAPVDSREQKRQKLEASYSKKVADLMRQCGMILRKLMSHRHGWVFNEPVDVVKLGLHDYYQIIKKPMDLGTIKAKLESGKYTLPLEFAEDVRLTFSNATTYNPPGHDVHAMADLLLKMFEDRWASLGEKLKALKLSADGMTNDMQRLVSAKTFQAEDASSHQETVGNSFPSLAPKQLKAPPPPKNNQLVPMVDRLPKRPMNFEEKRELSRNLESLAADKLEQIVQIIKSKDPNLRQTDDEIEVDIDSFDTETLWELHQFVLNCNKRKGNTKKGGQKVDYELTGLQPPNGEVIITPKAACRGNDGGEEEVDIVDDVPCASYPPVVIDKDGCGGSKHSSCSSSSESGSSSSDSDSGSSSGSDSDGDAVQSADPCKTSPEKEHMGTGAVCNQVGSPSLEMEGSMSEIDKENIPMTAGEGSAPEQQVSPEKLLRAALLKNRFADTILKAQEKTLPLNKVDRSDPEKLRKEREDLERRQREEKARLQAEAKAAEIARKKAEAEAAAEARRKREAEREAARLALQQMEKTVEINENCEILKDLDLLRTSSHPAHVPSSGDETSPTHSPNGLPAFAFQGGNPLEQLGLFMKDDEEEEERENLCPVQEEKKMDYIAGEEDEEGEIED